MEEKEFEVPVPWGHIAVKSWGNENNQVVFLIHGTSDNAGSFDRLVPLLPNTFYYVAFDLPGHGKSSCLPENIPLHEMNYMLAIHLVFNFFNREKIIIIGHSWGGQMGMLYSQFYPERVLKLVIIEAVYFSPISLDYFKQCTTEYIDKAIELLGKAQANKPPVYTFEKAKNAIIHGRMYGKLKPEAAEPLLKRCLKSVGDDQYHITNDLRLKTKHCLFVEMEFCVELIKEHPVTCPLLIIVGKDSTPLLEYYKEFLKVLKNANNKCTTMEVEGNHDVHNNSPELVGPPINNFLTSSNL